MHLAAKNADVTKNLSAMSLAWYVYFENFGIVHISRHHGEVKGGFW